MFDVGFSELVVIGVVALVVIGPDRLPRAARTAGLWMGRARRFVSSVKADIERDLAADELKKTLARQAESNSLYEIVEDVRQSVSPPTETPSDSHNKSDTAVSDKSNDTNG